MRSWLAAILIVFALAPLATAEGPTTAFRFRDTGDEAGLLPELLKIAGHGVCWGDVDGDGWPELYVGTFGGHPYDSKSNRLFFNKKGRFQVDDQPALRVLGRANGGVFADFDNDGDLDLYITNHAIDGAAYGQPHYATPNALFRNDGNGKMTDVSAASECCPKNFAARSATILDYDGDGRVDLLVGECFFQGGQSKSRLFRNLGELRFQDVSRAVGLPEKVTGFGVAAGDVNNDGWPDIFLAGRNSGNKLFINDRNGHFRLVPETHANFEWTYTDTNDDTACGVTFGDVNRDGLLDIVVGQHFDRPWFTGGVPVRLYLNRGVNGEFPTFADVTHESRLKPLPMKGPHIEVQDFDNDGWPDLYVSIVKFAGDRACPMIFKNLGPSAQSHPVGNPPLFHEDTLAVNDFPTEEDRKSGDVGAFFTRMEREHKVVYMAPGASADYDRDGRLDLFLANWWVNSRSLLLRNETPGGNWLDVSVGGFPGVNPMGVGAVIRLYTAGKLSDPSAFLGSREISVGYGYASGQEAIAHFGLGKAETCDIEVQLPHGKGRLERRGVTANQRIAIKP